MLWETFQARKKSIKNGVASLSARIQLALALTEQRSFTPDEAIPVSLEFDNPAASFQLKNACISLRQQVVAFCGAFLLPETQELVRLMIPATTIDSGRTTVPLTFPLQDYKDFLQKAYSCEGEILTCRYWFNISFDVGCNNSEAVEFEVFITSSAEVRNLQPLLPPTPPGWDPLVMDRVKIRKPA